MSPRLLISLLGPPELRLGGAPVSFRYDKMRALLFYLAVENSRAHPRDALAGLLWPDVPDADSRRNLSQAVFNLRQSLGEGSTAPAAENPYLLVSRETLQFNPTSDHDLDVAQFRVHLAKCEAHPHAVSSACPECADWRKAAAGLYRGDFLQDFYLPDSSGFEDWVLLTREELRRHALDALRWLGAFNEDRADYEQSVAYARRQLALEPWREEAHRDLMRLLALSGQRSAALAQYEVARKVLANELGVPPAPETEALLTQIKAGQWEPSRAVPVAVVPEVQASSLPVPLTAFVGRERELAELARLLADPGCRLLTLAGPGGIGKTRLAVQCAAAQAGTFALGAAWVPLAPVLTTDQMILAVAEALGLTMSSRLDPIDLLAQKLGARTVLLVLDNFEHLLTEPASTTWLTELMRGVPGIKLLVTSREALELQGEWVYPVEGLGDEAVDLFTQAARRLRAGFELSEADLPHVGRIARLVGATPLAMELAASWVRVLSCAEIADEIAAAFAANRVPDLLVTQARDVPEQHRSMAAVFEHSWQLLTSPEQAVLSRLAVFRGGFSRSAAEQVAGATLAVISALSTKSLLKRVGTSRYDLHPLIQQYAADRLAQSPGELNAAYAAHCAYCARFMAERAAPMRGAGQREAIADVAGEFDNIQAAWDWAVHHGRVNELHQMGLTVYYFAQRRSRYREGATMLTNAIACVEGEPSLEAQEAHAGFLLQRGWLQIRLGQIDQAETDFIRGQAIFDRIGREPVHHMLGDPVMARGVIASIRGDYATAIKLYEAALEFIQNRADPMALAYVHMYLASTKRVLGDLDSSADDAHQAHVLARQANQPWLIAFSLDELGFLAQARGDFVAARDHFERAHALREVVGDPSGAAASLVHLGQLAFASGQLAEAREFFNRSLAVYRENGDQGGLGAALHGLGRVALGQGYQDASAEYLKQALAVADRSKFVPLSLSILASLSEVLAQSGQPREARRLASIVVAEAASNRDARGRAADVLEKLGPAPKSEPPEDLEMAISRLLEQPA